MAPMAYNLPNLTPAQLALPLRVGLFYAYAAVSVNRAWDLELLSFNEALGMCVMRTRWDKSMQWVRMSTLRLRYKVRGS